MIIHLYTFACLTHFQIITKLIILLKNTKGKTIFLGNDKFTTALQVSHFVRDRFFGIFSQRP